MGKLIGLPNSAISRIAESGFRPVEGQPNTFVGNIKSQARNYSYVGVLVVLPLQRQRNMYVFTLTVNGEDGFKGKVGDLDDFEKWLSELPHVAE
jgi:hypothetical protein